MLNKWVFHTARVAALWVSTRCRKNGYSFGSFCNIFCSILSVDPPGNAERFHRISYIIKFYDLLILRDWNTPENVVFQQVFLKCMLGIYQPPYHHRLTVSGDFVTITMRLATMAVNFSIFDVRKNPSFCVIHKWCLPHFCFTNCWRGICDNYFL